MNNFKQTGIAAAIVTALGAAGSAQALTVGEAGEALLVPYALCDTANQVNTLVGITVPMEVGCDPTPVGDMGFTSGGTYFGMAYNNSCGDGNYPRLPPMGGPSDQEAAASNRDRIHWHFFSETSKHLSDRFLPATKEDFIPFDWCRWVTDLGGVQDGVKGYLVFTNVPEYTTDGTMMTSSFAMFGDAAIIEGNWASAAWEPVVPLADDMGDTDASMLTACENEVLYNGTAVNRRPTALSPLCAGIALDNDDGDTGDGLPDTAVIAFRYFLDPALGGATDIVFWTDKNCRSNKTDGCDRTAVPTDIFDTEENYGSSQIDLSKELNVIPVSSDVFEGVLNSNDETFARPGVNVTLVNQGHFLVTLPEIADDSNYEGSGPEHAAVGWSFIRFGNGANADQVQTALAQERGTFDSDGN